MIYIVEDDASIRELEQYALQTNGYQAAGCEDGASFWAALRAGMPELVADLGRQGVQMAVYSNKADEFSRQIVEHYFPGAFTLVRGKVRGVPVKPDPTGIHQILEELKADPAATLFVGDSSVDMETGHNAGLQACGVTWGFRSRESLVAAGADFLADTPEQLAAVILGKDRT